MSVKIVGTGSYVPERVLTNADLEKMVETSDEWIRTRTGIESRRLASSDQATSDLAHAAGRRALEMAGIGAEDLGLIIVATITPDHYFPNTACIVQRHLGAKNAFCFDLEAACSGLLYAVEVANGLMLAHKKIQYALVIGAEKLSTLVDWEDRNTCVLFGDGASALVLKRTEAGCGTVIASDMGSDGNCTEILKSVSGGSRMPATAETIEAKQHCIRMEGKEVFKCAVTAMVNSCQRVLEEAGVKAEELKWLVPHQANYRILKAVAQRLDVSDEHVYMNLNRFGNTSAASIGLCLDEMNRQGVVQSGDYVLLTAFGGGLTWGATLLKW